MKTRVVHLKKSNFDILIDRTTIFGNPFIIGKDGNRKDVICKHLVWLEQWLLHGNEIIINGFSNRIVINNLHFLSGKIIGCWCKPLPCHGDNLAKLADNSAVRGLYRTNYIPKHRG